jgi:hypothetical protein
MSAEFDLEWFHREMVGMTTSPGVMESAGSEIEQNLYMALTSMLDNDQVAAALQALRTVVGQLPAGQALQRRIADRDPARSAARPH